MSDKYIDLFKYDVSDVPVNYDKKPGEMEDFDEGVVIGKVPDEKFKAFGDSVYDDMMDDPTLYSVVIDTAEIKNAKIVSNVDEAIAGSVVKLTVIPDEGYIVKKLTVKSKGTELDVVEISENNYEFIMPYGDIDVECEMISELDLPLRFTNIGNNSTTVGYYGYYTLDLWYRINGEGEFVQWTKAGLFESNYIDIRLEPDDYVEIIGDNERRISIYESTYNPRTGTTYKRAYFKLGLGSLSVSGNLMSMVHKESTPENSEILPVNLMFSYLFKDCQSLVDAHKLNLSAKSLTNLCYEYMFTGCTNLFNTPKKLPATTLANGCYQYMFQNCTSLTTAPELPATTLTDSCYYNMFTSCTSLTTVPSLPATTLANNCYANMFYNCTNLTTTPKLQATTLASSCYSNMFNACTSLTSAPSLPATTLADSCYGYMFYGCTSLTTVPKNMLPATTLANSCYYYMFSGCTSLTSVPDLPATTLANNCYANMFYNCTSLTESPTLLASELVSNCYRNMFNNCQRLNHVKCLAVTGIDTNSSTYQWLSGVSSSGLFEKAVEASWPRGTSGVPTGWTLPGEIIPTETFTPAGSMRVIANEDIYFKTSKISTGQTLYISTDNEHWGIFSYGADYLVNSGDSIYICGDLISNNTTNNYTQFTSTGLFSLSGNLVGLWSKDDLGVELKEYCGYYLFQNCSNLIDVSNLAIGISETTIGRMSCYYMFNKCTSILTTPLLPAATLGYACYQYMFWQCTSLTTVQSLPATTLAEYCYYEMFYECKSLINVPVLPAETLAVSCYDNMFSYCTSLTAVPQNMLPATDLTGGNYCYHQMFYGCNSLVTPPALPATVLINYCYSGMFQSCTSMTTAPELPATTLAVRCYEAMFENCSALVSVPQNMLPATTLSSGCYYEMFRDCTSLTSAPELPATTLDNYCYYGMFQNCKSLIESPVLPAEDIQYDSYRMMFNRCTALSYVKCLAIYHLTNAYGWLENTASYGVFIKNEEATGWTTGISGIPNGWIITFSEIVPTETFTPTSSVQIITNNNTTSLIGAGKISSGQTLYISEDNEHWEIMTTGVCYTIASGGSVYLCGDLISDNTSENNTQLTCQTGNVKIKGNINALWSKDNLSSPLKKYCGYMLFKACGAITDVSELQFPNTISEYCYYSMFAYCSKLISVSQNMLPATTLADNCYASMFYNCTNLTTTPKLQATTLASSCYSRIFQNCVSLTTAPELPATTLAYECYQGMFAYCNNLTTVPQNMLPATTLESSCYNSMFSNCSNLTTAPDLPAETLVFACYFSMFNECSKLSYIKCLATNISAHNCTYGWVNVVASNGTFVKHHSMNSWAVGTSGIPSGWTVQDATV